MLINLCTTNHFKDISVYLFMVYLTTISSSGCIVSNGIMMNCNACGSGNGLILGTASVFVQKD
jgi:hypothetical protein